MVVDKELVEKWIIVLLFTGLMGWMAWKATQPEAPLPEHGPHVCYAGVYTDGGYGWMCSFHTRKDYCRAKPYDCKEGR
jgi:hypothetical protein